MNRLLDKIAGLILEAVKVFNNSGVEARKA